jgi:hypothetical protein
MFDDEDDALEFLDHCGLEVYIYVYICISFSVCVYVSEF